MTIVAILGVNAWWVARDFWPLMDLPTARRWVDRKSADKAQLDDAERALREHVRRSPHYGEARSLLGRVLLLKDQKLQGARQLHQVPIWWPKKREVAFIEGKAFRDVDHAREAEEALKLCVTDDPLHPTDPTYVLAAADSLLEIYGAESRWDEARAVIWDVYVQLPLESRPSILAKWIQTIVYRIDPKDSARLLRRFAAADPDDWQARLALARIAQNAGTTAEADALIDACLRLQPREPRIWRERLAMLRTRGDDRAMQAEIERLPDVSRLDPETWALRGQLLESTGDLRGALAALQTAVKWRPFAEEYVYQLSLVERRLGQASQANEHFRRYKALAATRASFPSAAQAYRDAINGQSRPGDPDAASAAARLASICDDLGWPRAAEAWDQMARSR